MESARNQTAQQSPKPLKEEMGGPSHHHADPTQAEEPAPLEVLRNTNTSAYYKSIEKSRYSAPPRDSDSDCDQQEESLQQDEELIYP